LSQRARHPVLHAWLTFMSATTLHIDTFNVAVCDWTRLHWLSCTRPFLEFPPSPLLHLVASRKRLPCAPGLHQHKTYRVFSASSTVCRTRLVETVGTNSRP
jgi:hypothetical protein